MLNGYDVIGDIHGCADRLEALLSRLGYEKNGGVWRHPDRMVVFLGDYIDRGPQILETLTIVRNMRAFIDDLVADKNYSVSLLDIGDGVLIAYKN